MPIVELRTIVRASPERLYDLSRDLDLHRETMHDSGEQAIGGKTAGLLELDEEVVWRGRHFGFWHQHVSRITAVDPPHYFRDEMVRGRFAYFTHDHWFDPTDDGRTIMRDRLDFASPLGPLGRLVDTLVMRDYLTRLLVQRNEALKAVLET